MGLRALRARSGAGVKPLNPFFQAAVETADALRHLEIARDALECGAYPKALKYLGLTIQSATRGMEEIFLVSMKRNFTIK